MFSFRKCKVENCHTYALWDSDYCYHHTDDKKSVIASIMDKVEREKRIENISIVNAEFEAKDFSTCFIGFSNFAFCTFRNCTFSSSRLISNFFDYAVFESCTFKDLEARYNVFSGSMIIKSDFSGSNLILSSFMGVDCYQSCFDNTDLYYSNFSLSKLINSSFEDSNLKRCSFRSALLRSVSFKYSNPEEAFFRNVKL